MTRNQLLVVESEMARLQRRIGALMKETLSAPSGYSDLSKMAPHLAAAVKRSSLDVSQALVELRRKPGK